MSIKNTGGPAFPRPAVFTEVHGLASVEQDGMTLRDYFAAKALQGMLTNQHLYQASDARMFAKWAYTQADAMLKARET